MNLDVRFSILAFLWFVGLLVLVFVGGYTALGGSDVNALTLPRQESGKVTTFEFTASSSDAWMPLHWSSLVGNLQSQVAELGDAQEAENPELASYRLGAIETLLGISPVGWSSGSPMLLPLSRALADRDWERAGSAYREFVSLCTACAVPSQVVNVGRDDDHFSGLPSKP